MPKISVQAGSTSVSLPIFVQASTSTTGLGLTGLAGTSAGLQAWYYRGTGAAVPITLATSSLNAAYTSGLFVEINSTATGLQGAYRFDVPDAAFATASNVRSCLIGLGGAANMAPLPLEVELTAWNNQDGVAGGMVALSSTGTLGSVSNVRGTATVILAAGTHAGVVIPVVQTASGLVGTVVLAPQVHTSAIIPIVQTASNLVNGAPGTATVILAPVVHTGAIIPIVQTASQALVLTTSNDGRMANLDLNVGAVQTNVANVGTNVTGARSDVAAVMTVVGTSGVAITTTTMDTMADHFLDRNMAAGPDTGGTGTGPRTVRQALRPLRNHWTIGTDGNYTSFKEDDLTISFAKAVISTSTANLITGLS